MSQDRQAKCNNIIDPWFCQQLLQTDILYLGHRTSLWVSSGPGVVEDSQEYNPTDKRMNDND